MSIAHRDTGRDGAVKRAIAIAGAALAVCAGGIARGEVQLDVRDDKLIIAGGDIGSWNGSAYTGVTGLIQSGRGDGSWNGDGIVTSMTDATTSILTTLAVALAEDVGYAGGIFGGVSVDVGDVLVMYTWGGDAELDGDLDGDDYFWIDSNVGNSGSVFGFAKGDFDYDGDIDGDDYFIIDSNLAFAQSQPDFPTGAGPSGLSVVPEPAGIGAIGAAATVLRRRRRDSISPSN